MKKSEVLDLCADVRDLPYAVLMCRVSEYRGGECDEQGYPVMGSVRELKYGWKMCFLSYAQYMYELQRDRPWCGPYGVEAYYEDELSEQCEKYYARRCRGCKNIVTEYESTHKGKIPKWALPWTWR